MKSYLKRGMRAIAIVLTISMCTVSLSFAAENPTEPGRGTETGSGAEDTIVDLLMEDYQIQFVDEEAEYTYTGEEIKPEIKVVYTNADGQEEELKAVAEDESENYTVSYENNVNAGEAKVVVTGNEENGYTGSIEKTFSINPKSLEGIKPVLKTTAYYYSGSVKVPSVTLKDNEKVLVLNKDYKVTATAKEVGAAKATIEGIGNYTGKTTVSYTISLGKVSSLKTSPGSYVRINLSWKKVAGASGYAIYRRTSTGSYKRIKTITSGSTVSWGDTSVKMWTVYGYKIRAYRTVNGVNQYSVATSEVSQRAVMGTPDISKVSSASYSSIKISWGKKYGASGYGIYRSTSEKGTYTRIGTSKGGSNVSYTDTGRTCGRTYYYKVRAYRTVNGKNYYGYYSAAKSGMAVPARVTISKSSPRSATTVTLKWNKSTGASGYAIYRSTSSKTGYTRVKTITSGSTLSWRNTGLTSGRVYYYIIRPYRTVNGKNVYGPYSSVYKKEKGGWKYVNGYKLYYDASGNLVKNVDKIIGKQSSYVIKVNKKRNVVTVYAKDGSKGYIIPVKSFVCSTGYATPSGTFYTPNKYRWHTLMGPCWGQWCTRITGGVLFHSVFYNSPNNNKTLSVNAYNKLGTTCSHGCVRLKAGDAKWIYDNCKLKTKVIVYSSSTSGPFGKPGSYKLPSWHRWDPTDPNVRSLCKSRGCH